MRNVSARELQVKANIPTFDTLQRKLIYRFIERCFLSSNVYVNYTISSTRVTIINIVFNC